MLLLIKSDYLLKISSCINQPSKKLDHKILGLFETTIANKEISLKL